MSDFIQFLSDRDPSPWARVVGFVPDSISREVKHANNADLYLTCASRAAVVEVKLGHHMSADQQDRYETLAAQPDLYLAALASDEARLASHSDQWTFLSLGRLVREWESSTDSLTSAIAKEVADLISEWDRTISGLFAGRDDKKHTNLSSLHQKFLARVVTRRVAHDLRERGRLAWAGVTSGGGLPIVQSWTPIRDESSDRTFIAEVRWWEAKPGGELRFGVDFDPRPDQHEDEEVRRAAYVLARSMDDVIDFPGLHVHLTATRPDLASLLSREKPARPQSKGDWEQVIVHGMKGAPLDGRKTNSRRTVTPDFFGDGALRFQAIIDIDFNQCSASDLIDLVDGTLAYLSESEPQRK